MYIETTNKKTVQINKEELNKCNNGQRFEANVITRKWVDDVITPKPPKKPTTRDLLLKFMKETRTNFKSVQTTQKQQGEAIQGIQNILIDHDKRLSSIESALIDHGKRIEKLERHP